MPGGGGARRLSDEQGSCDGLVFLIVQTVGGFDMQSQRAAVSGCDADVERMGKQDE